MKEKIKMVRLDISEDMYNALKVVGRKRGHSVPGVCKAIIWETLNFEDMFKEYESEFKEALEKTLPSFMDSIAKKEKK